MRSQGKCTITSYDSSRISGTMTPCSVVAVCRLLRARFSIRAERWRMKLSNLRTSLISHIGLDTWTRSEFAFTFLLIVDIQHTVFALICFLDLHLLLVCYFYTYA